jgi:hypothetical protein
VLHLYLLLIPRDGKKGFREENKSNGKTTRWLMQSHSQSQRNIYGYQRWTSDYRKHNVDRYSFGCHNLKRMQGKKKKELCMGNRVNYSLVLVA